MGYKYTFFKPNSKSSGSLLDIETQFSRKKGDEYKPEYSLFLGLVKQTGWNAGTNGRSGTGSFKDGEKVNVKLGHLEVAAWVHAIRNQRCLAQKPFFHKSESSSSQIDLDLIETISVDGKGEKLQKIQTNSVAYVDAGSSGTFYYVIKVLKDGVSFRCSLTLAEAETLRIVLETSLVEYAHHERKEREKADAKKRNEDRGNSGKSQSGSSKGNGKQSPPRVEDYGDEGHDLSLGQDGLDMDDDDIPF